MSIDQSRFVVGFHKVNDRTPSSRQPPHVVAFGAAQARRGSRDTLSREERKEATRRGPSSRAALKLLEGSQLRRAESLREVTREAGHRARGVFYRHFESMEALGLVLIDESFRAACATCLRSARAPASSIPTASSSRRVDILRRRRQRGARETLALSSGRERSSGVTVFALCNPHRNPV